MPNAFGIRQALLANPLCSSVVDDLGRALARVTETRRAERQAREELHNLIRHKIATGPRGTQAELVRRTGYTRERLRQIARDTTGPHQCDEP